MYIHLGRDCVVRSGDIVAVFDIDNASIDKRTRVFLRRAESQNRVVNVTDDLPKSFVVCEKDGREQVYISGIASAILKKRAAARPGTLNETNIPEWSETNGRQQ